MCGTFLALERPTVVRRPVLLLVGLLAACGSTAKVCTLVGCTDEVSFEGPSGSTGTVTVCVEGECKRSTVADRSGSVPFPGMAAGATVTATLVLSDGSKYTDRSEAVTIQPNGPGCDPSCVVARIEFARAST
jgi:hypothetical protein